MSIPASVGLAVIGTGLGLNPLIIGCGAAAMDFAASQAGSGIKIQGEAGRLGNQRVKVLPKEVASNLRAEVVGTGNLYSARRAVHNLLAGGLGLFLTGVSGGYLYKKSLTVKGLTEDFSSGVLDALQVIPVVGNQVAAVRNKRNFQQAVHLEKQKKEQEIVDLETEIADLEKKVIKKDQDQILEEILKKLQYKKGESLKITDAELFYCLQFCERSNNFSCLKLIISKLSNNKNKERADKLTQNFKNWLNRVENRIKNLNLTGLIGEFASSRDFNYLGYVNKIWIENRTIPLTFQEESQLKDALEKAVLQSFDRQEKLNQELNDLKEKLYQKKLVNLYEDLVYRNRQYATHRKQRPASFDIRHPLNYSAVARWNRREMQLKKEMEQASQSFLTHLKSEDLKLLGSVCDQEGMCCGGVFVRGERVYVHRDGLVQEAKKREEKGESGLAPANVGCQWNALHTKQINISSGKTAPMMDLSTVSVVESIKKNSVMQAIQEDSVMIEQTSKKIFTMIQQTFRAACKMRGLSDERLFEATFTQVIKNGHKIVYLWNERDHDLTKAQKELLRKLNTKKINNITTWCKKKKDIMIAQAIQTANVLVKLWGNELTSLTQDQRDFRKKTSQRRLVQEFSALIGLWNKDDLLTEDQKQLRKNETLIQERYNTILSKLTFRELLTSRAVCDQNGFCCVGEFKVPRKNMEAFLDEKMVAKPGETLSKPLHQKNENSDYIESVDALKAALLAAEKEYSAHQATKPTQSPFIYEDGYKKNLSVWNEKNVKLNKNAEEAAHKLLGYLQEEDLEDLCSVCDQGSYLRGGNLGLSVYRGDVLSFLSPAEPGSARLLSGKTIYLQNERNKINTNILKFLHKVMLDKTAKYEDFMKKKSKLSRLFCGASKKEKNLKEEKQNAVLTFLRSLSNREINILDSVCENGFCYAGELRVEKELVDQIKKEKNISPSGLPGRGVLRKEWEDLKDRVMKERSALQAQIAHERAVKNKKNKFFANFFKNQTKILKRQYHNQVIDFIQNKLTDEELLSLTLTKGHGNIECYLHDDRLEIPKEIWEQERDRRNTLKKA